MSYSAEFFSLNLRETLNKEIRENLAYLRQVLGIRYVGPSFAHTEIPTPYVEAPSTASLSATELVAKNCELCKLARGRKNVVFGSGPEQAEIMFIGESPGEQEDTEGLPFVSAGGQLLTKMIEAMGLKRENVYLTN